MHFVPLFLNLMPVYSELCAIIYWNHYQLLTTRFNSALGFCNLLLVGHSVKSTKSTYWTPIFLASLTFWSYWIQLFWESHCLILILGVGCLSKVNRYIKWKNIITTLLWIILFLFQCWSIVIACYYSSVHDESIIYNNYIIICCYYVFYLSYVLCSMIP